jgi:hypothetical protein
VRRAQFAATATATAAAIGTVAAVGAGGHRTASRQPGLGVLGAPPISSPAGSATVPGLLAPVATPSASAVISSPPAAASALPTTASSVLASPVPMPTTSVGASSIAPVKGSSSNFPAEIAAVALPNPAPGFPLRRMPDQVDEEGFGPSLTIPSAVFLLGTTPDRVTPLPSGGTESDPAGPEATIIVVDGHPFDLSAPKIIEDESVTGSVTLPGGLTGYLTKTSDQLTLYVQTGRFQVLVAGWQITSVDPLVTLFGALTGLQ